MGYQYFKRPIGAPGITDAPPGTGVTALSTAFGVNIVLPMKTTGSPTINRVVKITSSGTVKCTTGTSGRPAIGIIVTSGSTARVCIFGFAYVLSSSAALAKGARIVASSGAFNSSRYKGGCVRALNTAIASTLQHGNCLGWTLTSAAASSGTSVATNKKVLVWFNPMGRVSTGS